MDLTTSYNLINAQANANNAWSAAQAQKQMDFQKYMSDTAHQREVADLKAAGLNPVLSSGGSGASTPSGAMGSTDTGNTAALMNLLEKSLDANQSSARAVSNASGHNADGEEDGDKSWISPGTKEGILDLAEGMLGRKGRLILESAFELGHEGYNAVLNEAEKRGMNEEELWHNSANGSYHHQDKDTKQKNKDFLRRIGDFFRTNARNSAKAVDAYLGQG